MKVIAEPMGPEYEWGNDSEITEVQYKLGSLSVFVDAPDQYKKRIEIRFKDVRAYQVLDEGDLIVFWENGLGGKKSLAFTILEGGWHERMPPGIMSVTNAVGSFTEYLVTSINDCVCVVCSEPPEMIEHVVA